MRRLVQLCAASSLIFAGLGVTAWASGSEWQAISVTQELGPQIDSTERSAYALFPGYDGFVEARFLVRSGTDYRMEIDYLDSGNLKTRARSISTELWELTVGHAELVEEYDAIDASLSEESTSQYALAMKYAARARYEVARPLMLDITTDFPNSTEAITAEAHRNLIERLAGTRRALFLPGPLFSQSGRTSLMIFSGYYGVWAGVAVPVFFEADGVEPYAAGLLAGAPVGLTIAHFMTKGREITVGKADMISLGGHFGTWQGIGWMASSTGAEAHEAVGVGLLGGLAGIGSAILLSNAIDITEGHAALTSMALPWSVWLGFAGGVIAGEDDGAALTQIALIASDILVVGTGITARNVRMSQARARLMTIAGVAGGGAGLGVALLAGGDNLSAEGGFAGAAVGSIAGLVAGILMTRRYDDAREYSSLDQTEDPTRGHGTLTFTMRANPFGASEMIPHAAMQFSF